MAAVNPVDVPQLFFFIQKEWPQFLDMHSQSLYFFVTCGYEGIVLALSLLVRYCQVLPLFLYTLAYESEQGVVV